MPHPLLARRTPRATLFARDRAVFDSFLAGQLACLRELTLLLAPNINSYKRYAEGSFAPDRGGLGRRQPHLRAARRRPRRRRCGSRTAPGGSDLNPYLALSAMIAAGLHGVEQGLELEPAYRGQRLPGRGQAAAARRRCATPATCSPTSDVARPAFGDEVVDHYVNAADVELAAFEAAVTDWERFRGFERL